MRSTPSERKLPSLVLTKLERVYMRAAAFALAALACGAAKVGSRPAAVGVRWAPGVATAAVHGQPGQGGDVRQALLANHNEAAEAEVEVARAATCSAACPRDGVAPPRGARARRGGAVGRGGGRRFVRGAVPCWLRRVHLSGVAGCAAAGAREVERLHDTGLTVPILCRPPRSSCSSLHARAGVAHAPAPLVRCARSCLLACRARASCCRHLARLPLLFEFVRRCRPAVRVSRRCWLRAALCGCAEDSGVALLCVSGLKNIPCPTGSR